MNQRQRCVLLLGMLLTFWFGFVSDNKDYLRSLSATLVLTAGGLMYFQGSVGTPGRLRGAAAALYRSRVLRIAILVVLVGPMLGIAGRAWIDRRSAEHAAAVLAAEEAFQQAYASAVEENAILEAYDPQCRTPKIFPTRDECWSLWLPRLRSIDKAITDRSHALQLLGEPVTTASVTDYGMKLYDVAFGAVSSANMASRRRVAVGKIDSAFYASAARASVPDEIIATVAELLGASLNFEKLVPGAQFSIQFEELGNPDDANWLFPSLQPTWPGRLLSVRIVEVGGKVHEAIWFQRPDDVVGRFYTSKGEEVGRPCLRFPTSFNRIGRSDESSVEFEAPVGTPVRAVCDGLVEAAHGPSVGDGASVRIQHDDTFESDYENLSRIAEGVGPGRAVLRGTVIGYVGSSAPPHVPHLRFAIKKNHKPVKALSAAAPRSLSLTGNFAEQFGDTSRRADLIYELAKRAGGALVLPGNSNDASVSANPSLSSGLEAKRFLPVGPRASD